MPHITVKLIGNPTEAQKKEAAEGIAKVIEQTFGKPRKYISVAVEGRSFGEWQEVYDTEIKSNPSVVLKPGYTNPKTFE